MIEDEKIIKMFFARSEQAIREIDTKYGKVCHKLSYNILNNRQDAEECVNNAYLGVWNTIPPQRPNPLLVFLCKRNSRACRYYRKKCVCSFYSYPYTNESISCKARAISSKKVTYRYGQF